MPLILVLVLWLAGLGSAAQFAKIGVIFVDLQTHYNRFGPASGFLLSLISLLGILFGLLAGILGAHIGFRRLLIWALALGAAMSLFQAVLPAFPLMLASRVLEGASHLAIVVATPTLIAEIAPKRYQGFALTLWGTFFGVAYALAALIVPVLIGFGGLPAVFVGHGVYMAAFTALLAVLLPTDIGGRTETGPWPGPAAVLARHRDTYRSPYIAAPAIGWVFYTLTFVSLLTVLPTYVDESIRAFVIAAMPIASIVSSMTAGLWLLRHVSAVAVVVIGFAASMALGAMLWIAPGSPILCIALFATLGLVQGASFAAVAQLNTETNDRALANGALAQMGNLGNTSGTPLLLAIVAWLGPAGFSVFTIVCYALALLCHLWMIRLRQRAPAV